MARIAHLLDHPGHGDSRVFRAALAQCEAGHEVVIFALNRTGKNGPDPGHKNLKIIQCHFDETRVIPIFSRLAAARRDFSFKPSPAPLAEKRTLRPLSEPVVPRLKRELGLQFWHRSVFLTIQASVTKFVPHVIHAHDLTMLPSGEKLASKLEAKLIYDSHEYERSRNLVSHERAEAIRIAFEAPSIKKADIVICVSDSIADQLKADYGIIRPQVIPNASEQIRSGSLTRKSLNLPESAKIAGYVGSLQPGRGLMTAIEALVFQPNWTLMIMGVGSAERYASLEARAEEKNVKDRVFIRTAIARERVCDAISLCDISLIPMQNTCLSYDYSLPNKLFQSVQANVPIVSTPLTEISAFINYFKAGCISKGFSASDIADALSSDLPKLHVDEHRFKPYSAERVERDYQRLTTALLENRVLPASARLPHMC